MRTLKKVLALSMVFAMAFSMMAGAAFNDQDQIDASLTEDIQLLTALEVFQGDEKGDFNPTDNVTRAQAAKMIYVLKNNGVDDEAAAFKGNSVYSDVPSGHWAEGYINYCTNLGIMSGWTEGSVRKFDPNGNVTGLELTKMLLCMIGYRADIQGYTGNGWQTNVLRDGAASAITTNYLPTIYNAAPRQWTARLMANAINAPYASYSRGELVTGSATEPNLSYGRQYLGLQMSEGYLKDAGKIELPVLDGKGWTSSKTTTGKDEDGTEITLVTTAVNNNETVQANKDLTGGNSLTFKTTVDPSLLGQHVKVYYKGTNTTTRDFKVYAVLATGRSKVYDATLADVTVGKNKDNGQETIKLAGYNSGGAKVHTGTDKIYLVKNLDEIEGLTPNTAKDTTKNLAQLGGNSNAPIRLVDQDGNGTIDLAFTTNSSYAIVDSHNAERNTLRLKDADGKPLKPVNGDVVNSESAYKKINFVNSVAADDVVKVTLDCTTGKKVWDIEKVEPISATATSYTLDKRDSGKPTEKDIYATVTVNGETLKFAKAMMSGYDRTTQEHSHIVNDNAFYTDGKFIVYSKGGDSVASVGNLAYLINKEKSPWMGTDTMYVKVMLSDGTQGQYELDSTFTLNGENKLVKDATINEELLTPGNVLSYSLSDNKIVLSQLKSDTATDGIKFAHGTQKYDKDAKTYNGNRIAEDAYFFVKSVSNGKNKYSVVKASELGNKTLTSSVDRYFATKKSSDGIQYVVFGVLEMDTSFAATASDYAFVKSAARMNRVDGNAYAMMDVVLPNGETTTIQKKCTTDTEANSEVVNWNTKRGTLIMYDLDSDGNATNLRGVDTLPAGGWADLNALKAAINKAAAAGEGNGVWAKATVVGWNGSAANVQIVKGEATADGKTTYTYFGTVEAPVLVNVASDVKTHIINTTDESYAVMSEGSVEKTAKAGDFDADLTGDAAKVLVGPSAYMYLTVENDQLVATSIFSAEEGRVLAKLWK